MQDVTNYIRNLGKSKEEFTFTVSLTYKELWALKGLAQNPHDYHQDNKELMGIAKKLFEGSKNILDYVNKQSE